MARYEGTIEIARKGLRGKQARRIATALEVIASTRKIEGLSASITVTALSKVNVNPSRAERLADAIEKVREGLSAIEELHDEVRDAFENIPENFADGDRAQTLETAADALDSVKCDLETACDEADSIEFVGMFG